VREPLEIGKRTMGKEKGAACRVRAHSPTAKEKGATNNMEANPLRRVLTSKAMLFVGLAMLVAAAGLLIASMAPVGQAGAAQNKAKPQPKSQFGAKEVINTNGALPKEGTYNKRRGGTLIVSAAGSGFSDTENKTIGMEVFVNGTKVGTAQVYTNEKLSHKAFVPTFAVVNGVPKGSVKIELKALNADTKTDQNDFFRVTVEEQPRG
jgi:hypothetical protein